MQKHELAPIALFAYKRLGHIKTTVDRLARNPEAIHTKLFVFSDGPKSTADIDAVSAVRHYIAGITGFAAVIAIEQPKNYGLATSIINGVTQVLTDHDSVIVLEDDLLVSPHFLAYMNQGLSLYSQDKSVASIHGYWYPQPLHSLPMPETFFLRGSDCWGWATWRRAWQHFNPDGRALLKALTDRRLTRQFDLDGYSGFADLLRGQIEGRNNSWAIRWHASCFLDDMYTLYPARSLVQNIGHDATGTNCIVNEEERFHVELSRTPIMMELIPVTECSMARKSFIDFFRKTRPGLMRRIPVHIKRLLRSTASSAYS